jgi:hypothetical protein
VATAEGRRGVGAATCARHGTQAADLLATLLNTSAGVLRCTPGPPRGPGPSPRGEFLEGRLRHACVPCRIAQFQPIATGIKKIEFPPGEDPLLSMIQVLNPDMPLPKQLARPDEGLRAHRERVMDLRILDKGVINRRGTFAEQDMVRTDGETRYPGVAEPAHRGETEQVPVEVLRLLQVVDGNGPVRDAFECKRLIAYSFFSQRLTFRRVLLT